MASIIAAWTFASFIYFKVALDAAFYSSLSVLAALLMAIILGGLIFSLSGVYVLRIAEDRVNATRLGKRQGVLRPTLLPMLLASVAFALVCRVVVFGFSKDLSKDVDILTHRNNLSEDFALFAFLVSVPIIVHFFMVVFSQSRLMWQMSNEGSLEDEPKESNKGLMEDQPIDQPVKPDESAQRSPQQRRDELANRLRSANERLAKR